MKVFPCSVIRRAEQACFEAGITTSAALMQYVIDEIWHALHNEPEFCCRRFTRVVVYAGKGNNAGDAIGLAARFDCPVQLRAVCAPEEFSAETQLQYAALMQRQQHVGEGEPHGCTLIIDGLLGSGVSGELRPEYEQLVQEMNALRAATPHSLLLAIDIPTGLQADTGELLGSVVQADVTAVIGCVKPGMLVAENFVGRLLCIPLPQVQLPQETTAEVADAQLLRYLPRRSYGCYKNLAGRVNIIAGSLGYVGAAQMCAEAAVAAGAGLVALYCYRDVYPILAARVAPEVMVYPVDSYREVPTEGMSALVMGPGLGRPPAKEIAVLRHLPHRVSVPVVMDADALNLAAATAWNIAPHCILTPHPGEMRRLYPQASQLTRAETVQRYLSENPCTLLLKGARSIISDGKRTVYNSTGGPYMANGGQGDVLAGVIGALAAQGVPALESAALGAYVCGLAAAYAQAGAGYPPAIHATQVIAHIQKAMRD